MISGIEQMEMRYETVLDLSRKTSMRCTVMAPGGGTWTARR